MSRRIPIRISQILAVSALTASFAGAAVAVRPAAVMAATAPHAIALQWGAATTSYSTRAASVADFLRERGIVLAAADYVNPSPATPLSDGMTIVYRPAVPVSIAVDRTAVSTTSSAATVAELLAAQNVTLGPNDVTHPALNQAVPSGGVVRVVRVTAWTATRTQTIAPPTVRRPDFEIAPDSSRIVEPGVAGKRTLVVRFAKGDDGSFTHVVVSARVTRHAKPRVVAEGIDEYESLARFAANGIARSARLAGSAMLMVATAYSADCSGCSGMTAIGRRAGHGIVAVDPSVIPLGTHLYIPGYGMAIAGDTGGAIHGFRIDLGFDSNRDALLFGRRQITVYRLK